MMLPRRLLTVSAAAEAVVGRSLRKSKVIVQGPRYFDTAGMTRPVVKANPYLMALSSVVGMYVGTYTMDLMYYDLYVCIPIAILVFVLTFCFVGTLPWI
jgi:hypothetical protein